MPTIFRNLGGYRFFFFSLDKGEPIHVHIDKDRKYAKFWLEPISLVKSKNSRSHELAEIRKLLEDNFDEIRRRWHEHFGREN
jgi:hypothetical protein